jgi:hypothetical protein
MPHRIHRGTKVYSIRSPHPCLFRGPPSGHANPLGYFDRVIFKLQAFNWQRRARYLGHRAHGQVKIDKKLVGGHFGEVAASEIPKNPPRP